MDGSDEGCLSHGTGASKESIDVAWHSAAED